MSSPRKQVLVVGVSESDPPLRGRVRRWFYHLAENISDGLDLGVVKLDRFRELLKLGDQLTRRREQAGESGRMPA